jgi:hypothetical protein
MDYIVIAGVKPYDGRYEFDPHGGDFTVREWGWIKRLAHHYPATILDGFRNADVELLTTFAVIALHRAGRIDASEAPEMFERFADVDFGSTITFEFDPDQEEADDADDAGGSPPGSSSSNGSTSGTDSTAGSESSEPDPRASGIPASATSRSDPETSPR